MIRVIVFLSLLGLFLASCGLKEEDKNQMSESEAKKSFDSPGLIDVDLNTSLSEPALGND